MPITPQRHQQLASERQVDNSEPVYVMRQPSRLLHQPTSQMLAEEIYAILAASGPGTLGSPVTINNTPTDPFTQWQRRAAAGGPGLPSFPQNEPPEFEGSRRRSPFRVQEPPKTPEEEEDEEEEEQPTIEVVPGDGSIVAAALTPEGFETSTDTGARNQQTGISSSSGGGGAVILLTAGSGSSYTCSVYGSGTSASPTATGQTAVAIGIVSGESLTVGSSSYYIAALIGSTYYFRPDLWS